jgi:glycosyltransferase involved in cell wall biosynthesis
MDQVMLQPGISASAGIGDLTVVVLNDFAHVQGGASKVAIDEAVSLAEAGLRVIFLGAVGPIGPQLAAAPLETICLEQPQLLDVARNPGVALQSMWNRKAKSRLRALLATLDPRRTIVHLHGYTKALSVSPVAAAQAAGFRVVCTLHDFFAACPNGAFFDYVQMAPCPRVALSVSCVAASCDKRHRLHKLFRVARGVTQRRLGHFPAETGDYITLSDRSANMMRPYLPASAHFHRLDNVIDIARRPAVAAAANQAITCVGRLDEEKGVRLLADAAAASGLKIVFVGDGPLRAELEARAEVTVTGWVTPAEVVARLDQARCLVFPSLWYETFGLVVDEAAARGVPAVVSDISAAAERVRDGLTGWHFRSGDAGSLAAALQKTRIDADVEAAGAAAYAAYWRDPPTRRSHAASLVGIYRTVLAA